MITVGKFTVGYWHVLNGIGIVPTATVKVKNNDSGQEFADAATGGDAISAIQNVIAKLTGEVVPVELIKPLLLGDK